MDSERLPAFMLLFKSVRREARGSRNIRIVHRAPEIYNPETPVFLFPERRPFGDVPVLHEHVPREERVVQPTLGVHAQQERRAFMSQIPSEPGATSNTKTKRTDHL